MNNLTFVFQEINLALFWIIHFACISLQFITPFCTIYNAMDLCDTGMLEDEYVLYSSDCLRFLAIFATNQDIFSVFAQKWCSNEIVFPASFPKDIGFTFDTRIEILSNNNIFFGNICQELATI